MYIPREYFVLNDKVSRQVNPRLKMKKEKNSFKEMRENLMGNLGTSPELFDLLCQCLTLDPAKRITVEDALIHPFFVN